MVSFLLNHERPRAPRFRTSARALGRGAAHTGPPLFISRDSTHISSRKGTVVTSEQERQQLEAEVARVDRRRAELEIVINTLAPDYRAELEDELVGLWNLRRTLAEQLRPHGLLCPELNAEDLLMTQSGQSHGPALADANTRGQARISVPASMITAVPITAP